MEAIQLVALFATVMFTIWIPASIVGAIFMAVKKEFIWMWTFILWAVLFTFVAIFEWFIIYNIYMITR